ncbi:unnamed protein product [Effrenium voratum]|uniref:SAP domain-containing protein n=1 Tax=Effrenium voratum TaxID=2562239 RepID=A0AA36HQL2_9DINO|nr:unnamed protein product [Effrenium voratum]CAJ1416125.1 unnamed protein product [Effrenium voratum]
MALSFVGWRPAALWALPAPRSRCRCLAQDWKTQASTLSSTLVVLLQALRRASAKERRVRLQEANMSQLRIISAGLRLRICKSQEDLVRKIADALAEDDKLAQKPIGKYLRPLPEDEAEQFQQRITDLKSRQLRKLCRALRLSTEGRKAHLAREITRELLERHRSGHQMEAETHQTEPFVPGLDNGQEAHDVSESEETPDVAPVLERQETGQDNQSAVLVPIVLENDDHRRTVQKEQKREQRRSRLREILSQELHAVAST